MLLHPLRLCWAQCKWTLPPLPLQRCGSDSTGRRTTSLPGSQVWPGCFREDQCLLLLTAFVRGEDEGCGHWWTAPWNPAPAQRQSLGENSDWQIQPRFPRWFPLVTERQHEESPSVWGEIWTRSVCSKAHNLYSTAVCWGMYTLFTSPVIKSTSNRSARQREPRTRLKKRGLQFY